MLFLDTVDQLCADLKPLIGLVRNLIIPAIQIGIPIILIVLGMFDLGKAVVASKEDDIKKSQQMLLKRCIYAVLIFFVVLIVTAVFNAIGGSVDGSALWLRCWNA